MKHLALIPARGGSTGVKDKNLKQVGGESLICKALNQCKSAGFFDQIVISTDSELIAKEISLGNAFVDAKYESMIRVNTELTIHKRSSSDAQALSLISDLVFKLSSFLDFDFLWLIQPTSPFRYKEDFTNLKFLSENELGWTSIVSLKDVAENHPDRMYQISERYVLPLLGYQFNDNSPRQILSKVFIKDGAFYIFTKDNLSKKIFLGDKILPFFREARSNINIDTEDDLLIAQFFGDLKRKEV